MPGVSVVGKQHTLHYQSRFRAVHNGEPAKHGLSQPVWSCIFYLYCTVNKLGKSCQLSYNGCVNRALFKTINNPATLSVPKLPLSDPHCPLTVVMLPLLMPPPDQPTLREWREHPEKVCSSLGLSAFFFISLITVHSFNTHSLKMKTKQYNKKRN